MPCWTASGTEIRWNGTVVSPAGVSWDPPLPQPARFADAAATAKTNITALKICIWEIHLRTKTFSLLRAASVRALLDSGIKQKHGVPLKRPDALLSYQNEQRRS